MPDVSSAGDKHVFWPWCVLACVERGGNMSESRYCLRPGPPAAPTFTPICVLPAGHDGECNWAARVALRNQIIADAASAKRVIERRRKEAPDA